MEEQIRSAFRRAMRDKIEQTVASPASAEDAAWVASLLREMCDRLKALTPRRVDLHTRLDSAIDVALIKQMLVHGAADTSDCTQLCEIVCEWLRMLCAPVQDSQVVELHESLHAASGSKAVGILLCTADSILTEIEALTKAARDQMSKNYSHS